MQCRELLNKTFKNYGCVVIGGAYYGSHKYGSRDISSSNPSGYIHIADINPSKIQLWSLADNEVISGTKKIWAKRSDTDSNHYAEFSVDGVVVTGHLSADGDGYFSFSFDSSKYGNGTHELGVHYVYSTGDEWDKKNIILNKFCSITYCKWLKRQFTCDSVYQRFLRINSGGAYFLCLDKVNTAAYGTAIILPSFIRQSKTPAAGEGDLLTAGVVERVKRLCPNVI